MTHEIETEAVPGAGRGGSAGFPVYTMGAVVSADGTRVAYRRLGQGPGVVLLHGGLMTSHNLLKLGGALANEFTVYIPDRRGRAASGPAGDDYGLARECEDLEAILAQTGARRVFGLSSGAIIAVSTARAGTIQKLALYEPPLTVPGVSHAGWVPRYERELARGDLGSAMVTILRGTDDSWVMAAIPRWLLAAFFRMAIRGEGKDLEEGQMPLAAIIPTMHLDVQLLAESDGALESFRAVEADVLLLGGRKSAPYLHRALDALGEVLPRARRVELRGVGHVAADNGGKPELVAAALRAFFA